LREEARTPGPGGRDARFEAITRSHDSGPKTFMVARDRSDYITAMARVVGILLLFSLASPSAGAAADCTAPPEIGTLIAADRNTFSWPAEPSTTGYAVVRGRTNGLAVGPGGDDEICFPDIPGATLVDATVPPPGVAFWYLVRGNNACGYGPYGFA